MQLNNKQILRPDQLDDLRKQSLISDDEYAYVAGDLVVAENVKTSNKRVLGKAAELLVESQKRILKG
jgi:hypothetical protein